MTDADFLQQFECCELDPKHFNHMGHLRLAVLYLNQYALSDAIDKVTSGIARYAASLGATDKFHHTLTVATVKIIWQRMQRQHQQNEQQKSDFNAFLQLNKDLETDLKSVIALHYTDECLGSVVAKRQFVEPDLNAFEANA